MKSEDLISHIQSKLKDFNIKAFYQNELQPYIIIEKSQLVEILKFLKHDNETFFDLLSCITGIDNGPTIGTMEIVYTLFSIPHAHSLHVRVILERDHPKIPTSSFIWKTAEWHEREAFDLLGIEFVGHPDLRRILMPQNWEGHPLKKDYTEQETFHGIKVKY